MRSVGPPTSPRVFGMAKRTDRCSSTWALALVVGCWPFSAAWGAETEVSGSSDAGPPPAPSASLPMPVLRRLTRAEYGNSLRDIFGVEFPFTSELPADGEVEGF